MAISKNSGPTILIECVDVFTWVHTNILLLKGGRICRVGGLG